jgi:ABC-type transport system substrate-binding protein
MPIDTTRRSLLRGLAAAPALALAPGFLPMAGIDLVSAAAPGGELRVGMTTAAVPLSNGCPDQGGEGLRFMGITLYDQLVAWDLSKADVAAVLRPCLATSWERDAANPKRWHFKLREGVKFHDGKLVEAADIVFSFDRCFKRDAAWFDIRASSQILPQLPNVAAWGSDAPMTFWMETEAPDGTVPYAVTYLGIVHRGAWEAAGKDWVAYLNKAVGTGPWKLDSYNQRERAVLLRNPDYWDQARVPKSARLVLMPVPDANSRIAALRSGQVNFIEAPPPDAVPSLQAAGFRVVTNQYPHNWTWMLAQVEGSPWRDIRLRKAINLGIDRSGMKELLGGLMVEGAGLVTKGNPWYGQPAFKLGYEPDAARKLVAEAGFGPRNPLRTKVAISASGSGQMQPLVMNEFIQQNLREIGIEVEFEVYEWQALIEVWKAGAGAPVSRGCMALNISQSAADPFRTFARILRSDQASPRGVNWSRYNDPAMDAMFNAPLISDNTGELDRLMARCHEEVVNRALFLFAAHDLNPRALAPEVKNFVQAQSWSQDLTPVTVG